MRLNRFLKYFDNVWATGPRDIDMEIQFKELLSDPEHVKNERLLEIQVVSYEVHENRWTVTLREASDSNIQEEDERN